MNSSRWRPADTRWIPISGAIYAVASGRASSRCWSATTGPSAVPPESWGSAGRTCGRGCGVSRSTHFPESVLRRQVAAQRSMVVVVGMLPSVARGFRGNRSGRQTVGTVSNSGPRTNEEINVRNATSLRDIHALVQVLMARRRGDSQQKAWRARPGRFQRPGRGLVHRTSPEGAASTRKPMQPPALRKADVQWGRDCIR